MEKLWQIQRPVREWHEDCFVNGDLRTKVRLPSGSCSYCGVFASLQTLPVECPAEIRPEIERLCRNRDGIAPAEFRKRANHWEEVLRHHGLDVTLKPGQAFLPIQWRIPSIPRCDLYWPSVGVVGSQRFKELFEHHHFTGIDFLPVVLGPVGAAEASSAESVRDVLEFDEGYYSRVQCVPKPAELGTFFKLAFAPAIESTEPGIAAVCKECGSIVDDFDVEQPERDRQAQHRILYRKYIPDTDAFRSHVYRGVIVRDRVVHLIPEMMLQNCAVEPITGT